MLKATAEFMLLVIMLDLIISAIWLGLLLIRELIRTYSEVFPDGIKTPQINIRRKIMRLDEENSSEECEYMQEHKSVIKQLEEVYGKNEDN